MVAYLWGAAIVLGVNVLVWPTSSERELRHTLVVSLEHIATFTALQGAQILGSKTPLKELSLYLTTGSEVLKPALKSQGNKQNMFSA